MRGADRALKSPLTYWDEADGPEYAEYADIIWTQTEIIIHDLTLEYP